MRRYNSLTRLIVYLLSILFIIACGGGGEDSPAPPPAPPPAFTTADLAGYSHIIGLSTGGTNQGIMDGGVTVGTNGNETSGFYFYSVGTTATLTGG